MSDCELLTGDATAVLATLPAGCVQTAITSPPFYGLRDYGTGKWKGGDPACDHKRVNPARVARALSTFTLGPNRDGVSGQKTNSHQQEGWRGGVCGRCGARRVDAQVGLEDTPSEYVARLVDVFREVRRVLRDDGTLWLNIASSYASHIIESEEHVIRDDLTQEERSYVLAELARWLETQSEAVSAVRQADAPGKPAVPAVLLG